MSKTTHTPDADDGISLSDFHSRLRMDFDSARAYASDCRNSQASDRDTDELRQVFAERVDPYQREWAVRVIGAQAFRDGGLTPEKARRMKQWGLTRWGRHYHATELGRVS